MLNGKRCKHWYNTYAWMHVCSLEWATHSNPIIHVGMLQHWGDAVTHMTVTWHNVLWVMRTRMLLP